MKEVKFQIQTRIEKPLPTVFEAVTNPSHLNNYFTKAAKGRIEKGSTVIWNWTGYEGELEVDVVEFEENKQITLEWEAALDVKYKTRFTISFEKLDEQSTLLKINESGWPLDENGVASALDHCQGWQHMSTCLKAYLEHGIDLRGQAKTDQ